MNITQLTNIKNNFLYELQEANAGKKTSLPFIVHWIPSASVIKNRESFQAMVIGGSVFKKAILKKTKNKVTIVKKESDKPVDFKTEGDFLEFIDQELSSGIKVLALNFAYPIKPVFEKGRLDGILLAVTKEGSFNGMVGKKLGEEIETYIWRKRKKRIIVSVANDTICLLLSGLISYKWNKLAAGIVGTGLNFAFFLDEQRLVNLESANFDKFPQSKEGKIIDQESFKPTAALFEKETAGAYLYKHFNLIVKERAINYPQISSTEELDSISRKNIQQASEIALNLLKKSAQLVAAQIAGITEFKKHDPTSFGFAELRGASMVFNMEGSLFWKGNGYKETVKQTVEKLTPKHNIRFVEIKDSAILGAAKLVS